MTDENGDMSDYTPTTEEVRRCYGDIHCSDLNAGTLEHHECPEEAEFDRWIARVEREAAARALEEAADEIFADPDGWRQGSETAAFHAGADSVYAGLRARAVEIRARRGHEEE